MALEPKLYGVGPAARPSGCVQCGGEARFARVHVREAARAVNYDYANYSAHLFLANSYIALSDPNLINLRYETPAENEYLLASLLAPVSAGSISPAISQQEYSRLFERDGFGLVSSTEYLSRGALNGAEFPAIRLAGNSGNFSFIDFTEIFYGFTRLYQALPGLTGREPVRNPKAEWDLKH